MQENIQTNVNTLRVVVMEDNQYESGFILGMLQQLEIPKDRITPVATIQEFDSVVNEGGVFVPTTERLLVISKAWIDGRFAPLLLNELASKAKENNMLYQAIGNDDFYPLPHTANAMKKAHELHAFIIDALDGFSWE